MKRRASEKEKIAWAAGLIEGEGCIRRLRGDRWEVNVTSTDADVIAALQEVLGGRTHGPYNKGPRRKAAYRWCATAQGDVWAVLVKIRDWLLARRRRRADEALKDLERRQHLIGLSRYSGSGIYQQRPAAPVDRRTPAESAMFVEGGQAHFNTSSRFWIGSWIGSIGRDCISPR